MPEEKPYPRPFYCENPACKKMVGVKDRDSHRIVSLYVLVNPLPAGTIMDEIQLTKRDFIFIHAGKGGVVCRSCGYVTDWHWNKAMLDHLIRKGLRDV